MPYRELDKVPSHLRRYIVDQDYEKYTAIDQAVWRFIMRQLTNFLSKNAHPCYEEGLVKSGISTEKIPKIEEMSRKLLEFGWRAVPVSGFIPPAAFMEMQSLSILPIASDMRTLEHLTYTPAPDIVHEAAGHAPILIDPEFSAYLHKYADVAKRAIINDSDLEIYEAIRELSDLKEDPNATDIQIKSAYARLEKAKLAGGSPSEAALLARMNWWTAEYGLIGDLKQPRIYGAGLMSSVGESRTSLKTQVAKIPFSLECLSFNYDITEPQPQLFVASSFRQLSETVDKLAETMAFRVGGPKGLQKAIDSKTVNTVQLDSGIQISGKLVRFDSHRDAVSYLQFEGPTQLSWKDNEISGHGKDRHNHGYGTPVGRLINTKDSLSSLSGSELSAFGLVQGQIGTLNYDSGVIVCGKLVKTKRLDGQITVLTFADCNVTKGDQILFKPEWGEFDLVVGHFVSSVYGGPADREAFGAIEDFATKRVPPKPLTENRKQLIALYEKVRQIRVVGNIDSKAAAELEEILRELDQNHAEDWLLRLEIFELGHRNSSQAPKWLSSVKSFLEDYSTKSDQYREPIRDGLSLAHMI